MKYIMIMLLRFYRKFISPLKPPVCRFTPSCSEYAIQAYSKRGFFAGTVLTVWRILRCNPFCRGGYDPVPEHGFRRVRTSAPAAAVTAESNELFENNNGLAAENNAPADNNDLYESNGPADVSGCSEESNGRAAS